MSAVAAYAADRTPSENLSAPYSEGRSAEARGDLGAAIAAYLNASDRHDAASPYAYASRPTSQADRRSAARTGRPDAVTLTIPRQLGCKGRAAYGSRERYRSATVR